MIDRNEPRSSEDLLVCFDQLADMLLLVAQPICQAEID